MRRRALSARNVLVVAILMATVLVLVTIGMASADDPVTVKLKPWAEGDVTVVDIAIANNTDETLKLDITGYLPAGSTFVGGTPAYKLTGGTVYWNQPNAASKKTLVGYQLKYRGGGAASVSVAYTGKSKGIVTATAAAAAAPAASSSAQAPLAAAKAPVGELTVVAVPANATVANAITGTLASGRVVAMGTLGLPNVPVAVPVTLKGGSADPQGPATKYTWTLSKPTASKAALDKTDGEFAKFTPDVVGTYKVDLVVANDKGSAPMQSVQIRAGTYIGVENGNCKACHSAEVTEWSETGHATKVKREIDGGAKPATSTYSEYCLACHTTGYYLGAKNGGFADVQAQTGWQFPSKESIQSGKAGNWQAMPAQLKNVANIQCESCHGPAKEHVASKAPMAASADAALCSSCHLRLRGNAFANAKHGEEKSQAWTYPTGPTRQACVRCHSGAGFVSFLENPTEQAAWDNKAEALTCTACHDPHSDKNKFQLRVVGKPIEAVGLNKDFGLSATCVECHNGRVVAADAQKGSYPHYSPAGEVLADTGGVDYGQKINDSAHGKLVGIAPVKNPSDPNAYLFGGAAPGACVACHMWPTPADPDPGRFKVGDHSFNAVSADGKLQNLAACQTCHAGVKTLADFKSKADYDGNGKSGTVQEEVAGLLTLLQKAIGDSGIKPVQGNPYFDRDALAKANEKQKNAVYNYRFVRGLEGSDGKANAIHNFKRSVQLLQLSYKDLTGKDVPNATLLK